MRQTHKASLPITFVKVHPPTFLTNDNMLNYNFGEKRMSFQQNFYCRPAYNKRTVQDDLSYTAFWFTMTVICLVEK